MNVSSLTTELLSLSIFCELFDNKTLSPIKGLTFSNESSAANLLLWAGLLNEIIELDCTIYDLVESALLSADNILSRRLAKNEEISPSMLSQASKEMESISLLCRALNDTLIELANEDVFRIDPANLEYRSLIDFKDLCAAYKKNGYGVFTKSTAFSWSHDDGLQPIKAISPIRLSNLKEYDEEKQKIVTNTRYFIKNLPANNVLLYGDRGTGKSSTVHAILNEFSEFGLRLIEVPKKYITEIPNILETIAGFKNLHFIIFLDDLAFNEGTDDYSQLKAALEGSISKLNNVLIYATTNRRHLIKESYSERSDEVHAGDAIQEKLSLSDRFGLVITFINPSKQEFFSILKSILADCDITMPDDVLSQKAERFALERGGRSPRAARQLADIIFSESRA